MMYKETIFILLLLCPLVNAQKLYVQDSSTTSSTDANDGTSWANSVASVTRAIALHSAGDTVLFGAGLWTGGVKMNFAAGTFADRSVIACSSFVESTDAAKLSGKHLARFKGGDSLSGWVQDAGDVYTLTGNGTSYITFIQDDTVLEAAASSSVTEGEWFYDSGPDKIYVHVHGGGDPDNTALWGVEVDKFLVGVYGDKGGMSNGDYMTWWGLDMGHTNSDVFVFHNGGGSPADSVFIEHCYLHHNTGKQGSNHSIIETENFDNIEPSHLRIRACSLTYSFPFDDNYTTLGSGTNGGGISIYSMDSLTIDSNYFGGYLGKYAIWIKNDVSATGDIHDITIAFNTFEPTNASRAILMTFEHIKGMEIYGNTFKMGTNAFKAFEFHRSSSHTGDGNYIIRNNTFYGNGRFYSGNGTSEGSEIGWTNGHVIKYNLFVGATDSTKITDSIFTTPSSITIDNNQYYQSTALVLQAGGSIRTQSYWQTTLLWDVNSTFDDNPLLADPDNGDFTPSSATAMNVTHNGKTWTQYGAIQAAGAARTRVKGVKP